MLTGWFFVFTVALFGLVIGSFLNVVIYRMHTGRSLNDRSHCLSCGRTLSWYELFPVLSYVALGGRCRSCSSFIPYRYALVELSTACLFVLAYLCADSQLQFLLLSALLSVLLVGVVYDLYHMIIPDEISILATIIAVLVVIEDSIHQSLAAFFWSDLFTSFASGAMISILYASLWYFSKGRWFGLGDAKLVFPLGMLVGISGLFSFFTLSFWIGAASSLLLLLLASLSPRKLWLVDQFKIRHVKIKSEVPFAPFMVAAFIMVYFFEADVLDWISRTAELLIW